MHPTIDDTSRRITEMNQDRSAKPIHQRLYDLDKEYKEKQASKILSESRIERKMTKDEKNALETKLYEDAKKREYTNSQMKK
jgi:hypothetical protein